MSSNERMRRYLESEILRFSNQGDSRGLEAIARMLLAGLIQIPPSPDPSTPENPRETIPSSPTAASIPTHKEECPGVQLQKDLWHALKQLPPTLPARKPRKSSDPARETSPSPMTGHADPQPAKPSAPSSQDRPQISPTIPMPYQESPKCGTFQERARQLDPQQIHEIKASGQAIPVYRVHQSRNPESPSRGGPAKTAEAVQDPSPASPVAESCRGTLERPEASGDGPGASDDKSSPASDPNSWDCYARIVVDGKVYPLTADEYERHGTAMANGREAHDEFLRSIGIGICREPLYRLQPMLSPDDWSEPDPGPVVDFPVNKDGTVPLGPNFKVLEGGLRPRSPDLEEEYNKPRGGALHIGSVVIPLTQEQVDQLDAETGAYGFDEQTIRMDSVTEEPPQDHRDETADDQHREAQRAIRRGWDPADVVKMTYGEPMSGEQAEAFEQAFANPAEPEPYVKPKVLMCAPVYGNVSPKMAVHFHKPIVSYDSVHIVKGWWPKSSVLPTAFGECLCEALDMHDEDQCDLLVMVHGDVAPAIGFVDMLHGLMWEHGAHIMSAVVPIKHQSGRTSTAFGKRGDRWKVHRSVWLHDRPSMPETFGQEVCGPDEVLLVNTGCMMIDIRHPFWQTFCFQFHHRMVTDVSLGGKKKRRIDERTEDYEMSHDAYEAGLKVMATWKVPLTHEGGGSWSNQEMPAQYVSNTKESHATRQAALSADLGKPSLDG